LGFLRGEHSARSDSKVRSTCFVLVLFLIRADEFNHEKRWPEDVGEERSLSAAVRIAAKGRKRLKKTNLADSHGGDLRQTKIAKNGKLLGPAFCAFRA